YLSSGLNSALVSCIPNIFRSTAVGGDLLRDGETQPGCGAAHGRNNRYFAGLANATPAGSLWNRQNRGGVRRLVARRKARHRKRGHAAAGHERVLRGPPDYLLHHCPHAGWPEPALELATRTGRR